MTNCSCFVLVRYSRAAVQALFKSVRSSTEGDTAHDTWLPPLTADLLLQPHLGLFPFPSYFSALHQFLADFYHSGRRLEASTHKSKPQDSLTFLRNEAGYTVEQVDIAASCLPDLLSIVDDEGIKLLLYHLEPLFTCLETRLHACTQLFDMLAQALGPKNTVKTFLKCLLSLFDSHAMDIYDVIIRQTFLSQIIVRFGLDGFLKHFISFVVDAVAFSSKVESKALKGDRLSINSAEGITAGIPTPEMEYTTKDVPLDIDDLELPGSFFRGASEDQDVQIGSYTMGIEELETQREYEKSRQTLGQVRDEDEKDDEIVEQVTLLPRGSIDEEGEGRLFQGHISDDDDDDLVTDEVHEARRAGKVSTGKIFDEVSEERGVGDGAVDVKDNSTLTAVGTGNGIANNVDAFDVEGKELLSENDPASDVIQKKQVSLEFDANEDNVPHLNALQSEKGDFDLRKGDVELQELEASKRKSDEISESLTEKEKHEIGVNNMVARNVTGQEKTENNVAGVMEELNEEDVDDKNPDGSIDEGAEDIEKGDENGEDSVEGVRLPEEENLASEEDEEESSSEDELQDNVVLEPEDEEVTKDQPTAYQIKTFYNGTKSKTELQEKKAQKEHDELTPGTISGVAAESIVWLAPRLGPVLTSKYIASQLLTMLPHCYMGYVGSNDNDDDTKTVNDRNAKWLLFCLSNFCTLYGEAFMLNQYLPYIDKTVSDQTQRPDELLCKGWLLLGISTRISTSTSISINA